MVSTNGPMVSTNSRVAANIHKYILFIIVSCFLLANLSNFPQTDKP
jgi:hypothetical protein